MVWFKDNLTEEELKKEYRRLCKKWHPDTNHSPEAEEYMKEINAQFDEYWTNQKIREFSWVDTWKAKQEARKVRATILCWLRRDRDYPGKYFAIVDEMHTWFWFWRTVEKIKGITDEGEEWNNFRGGLAYCSYGEQDPDNGLVYLHKLPAKISPATDRELYYYNKDHWGDSKYADFLQVSCRFGTFWATEESKGYTFYVKAELPEEFLKIGNVPDQAEYSARSINLVFVNRRWIPEAKESNWITGADLPYLTFQECTEREFREYHDVDYIGSYPSIVGVKLVREPLFIDSPVVSFCIRKGIIQVFQSLRNFRYHCGYFVHDVLKRNMHLLTIDDVEEVQDYLDAINEEFNTHFKQLVKRGQINLHI